MTEAQRRRIAKAGLSLGDFQPKAKETVKLEEEKPQDKITDELGNTYKQVVNTDGTISLVLIESYTGELFE